MDNYLILKFIHIIGATILAGTGIGIAFFMFMANRSKDIQTIAVTTRHVVLADWIFTTPAIFVQAITGFWLMKILDYSFTSPWFIAVATLFLLIGACWIPVVFIQYQLRSIATEQIDSGKIGKRFRKLMRYWTMFGVFAFIGIIIIFWLMVIKELSVS